MSEETQGPPGWIDKAKFIYFYTWNGCETTFWVYIRTGGIALENAVLTLLGFDMLDMVRALLRPKGLRGTAHGSRGKKNKGKGHATEAIPELPEIIGDEIRAETGLNKPKYSQGFDVIWEIDTVTQRHLYYVMIGSIIEDFAWDWYSGIIADPGSNCAFGRGQVTSNLEIVALPGFGQLVLNQIVYEKFPCLPFFTHFQLGEGSWFVTLACKAQVRDGPYIDQNVQMLIVDTDHGFNTLGVSERRQAYQHGTVDLIASCHVVGPIGAVFYEYCEHGGVDFTDIQATAFQYALPD